LESLGEVASEHWRKSYEQDAQALRAAALISCKEARKRQALVAILS
jgi:hypothetical protein